MFPEGGGFVNITDPEGGPTATDMIPEGGTTEKSCGPPPTPLRLINGTGLSYKALVTRYALPSYQSLQRLDRMYLFWIAWLKNVVT